MLEGRLLDRSVPIPLYYQLKVMLQREIQAGLHPCNVPLPPEERLADVCGISRTTVRQAINELVKEGWLYRMKAKGTFITDQRSKKSIAESQGKYGLRVWWQGDRIETKLLDFSVMTPGADGAEMTLMDEGQRAESTLKCIHCDGRPAAILRIYQIRANGMCPDVHRVRHVLRTTEASMEDMKTLLLKQSEPIQEVISTGFNAQGSVVEYCISRYCGSMCRVEITETVS